MQASDQQGENLGERVDALLKDIVARKKVGPEQVETHLQVRLGPESRSGRPNVLGASAKSEGGTPYRVLLKYRQSDVQLSLRFPEKLESCDVELDEVVSSLTESMGMKAFDEPMQGLRPHVMLADSHDASDARVTIRMFDRVFTDAGEKQRRCVYLLDAAAIGMV